jgi:hypothetical protein
MYAEPSAYRTKGGSLSAVKVVTWSAAPLAIADVPACRGTVTHQG